ncbi:MAG: FGGY family carbohydrate kinase, partial [Actinobacteria bacterium]|nr:FGGY family carbohydrate kinase [Actinomycetota bacterium]
MSGLLLGLDAGSRGIRCSVVDVESGQITSATRSWSAVAAPEAGVFAFNMDLACCWRLLGEVSCETLIKAKARPSEVLGVAVSGMRFSLVLVDEEGSVIFAAPNRDSRAAEEAIALANGDVLSLRTRTGHWPLPIFAAPRLQWLASNDPQTLRKAAHVLSLSDWIGYRLTGVPSTTPSQASGTLLFDVAEKQWLWELVKELGITERVFPPVVEAGTPLGGLLPAAAAHLGLLGGTPVVVGGADTQCAMLGVGAVEPEQLGVVAGSTTPIQLVTAAPWKGDEADLWVGNHVVPDRWVIESNAGPVGDSLNWFASLLFPGRSDGVQRFVANAAACTPGAGGIIYAGSANVMNAGEMAMPIGNLSFPPLAFADDVPPLPHLSRAVLEGMAHAVKRKVDQLVSTPVGRRAEVRMAGGMTQSPVWTRLVANILDRPVRVSACPDASSIGAAICAGVGAGAFPGLRDGVARLARVHEVMPDPEHTLCYRDLSLDWDRLIRARSSADQLAAGIALQHMILQAPGDGTASRWRPPSHPLRILVTADLDDDSLGAMRELGYVEYASYRDAMRLLTGDELAQAATGFHVFITEVDLVDKSVLLRLPDLRVVASCRGRAVNVDVAACSALAIPVLSVPGRNADAVADLTLAFMLALARKVVAANAFLHEPGRDAGDMGKQGQAHVELQGHELRSKTVGLVGFGAVGKAVTQRLQPFGPRVLVHDPYVDENDIRAAGGTPVPLKSLLSTSDYVSLHVPTTSETQELIGAGELSLMKQGAWLINTARGALVDEDALHAALSSGRLAGAALDVFRNEPPGSEEPLLALPNVLATPHIAGNTFDVAAHQGQAVVEDLSRMVRGEPPLGILNPDALQSFSWNEPRSVADVAALAASDSEFRPAVDDLRHEVTTAEHRASPAQIGQTASRPAGVAWDPGHTTTNPAKEQMERVLQSFVSSLGDDEALTRFAANNTVSSHYFVNDFGLEFHFRFREGRVTAGMGMPPEPVDVRMKARAENLDSILTGRLNGNKAALTGRLSFTGDLRLAMSMQKIQGDLVRLYSAAR